MKGRYIGFNIRTICDLIQLSEQMEVYFFAFLVYEKTFDTVHRDFLNKCLNHFGFPNYFKEWISKM